DSPVILTLGPPARAEFRVESPDGAPVAGARVRVTIAGPGYVALPPRVVERTTAATDVEGRAVVDAFEPSRVFTAEAEAQGYGIQPRLFDPPTAGVLRIALHPIGA